MLCTPTNVKAIRTPHKLNVYYMPKNIISSKCSRKKLTHYNTHTHICTDEVFQIQRHRRSKLP